MGRIRTIKPEFWRNETLSELPEATHMLAAALLNYVDDEGYFNANPKLIQAECCPLRDRSVSIDDSLAQLSKAGYLRLGAGSDGRKYGHIIKFLDHQVINRPTPSKISDLEIAWECSVSPQTQISGSSLLEGKGKEGNRNRERKGNGTEEGGADAPSEFDEWYAQYPKHVGRGQALKAYTDARKKVEHAILLEGAKRASRQYAKTENHFIPNPATWLNGERWLDEDVPAPKGKEELAEDAIYASIGDNT